MTEYVFDDGNETGDTNVITYRLPNLNSMGAVILRVFLDGKFTGTIRKRVAGDGFYYAPKDGGMGETLPTVDAVKRSIEE